MKPIAKAIRKFFTEDKAIRKSYKKLDWLDSRESLQILDNMLMRRYKLES